jgi:RNA polymerase sigma-70 factor, ECF subfamily
MLDAAQRVDLEHGIAAALAAQEYERAATLAIRGYGPEILGFLHAGQDDEDLVDEAFSRLCEELWKCIARFEGRCSFRTWMYTVARGTLLVSRRGAGRRARRFAALSGWEEAAAQTRTVTLPFLRSEVKSRFARLRDALPPEDQEILILRVDRALEWGELALVLSGRADVEEEELRRESARLRKRFQAIRERLRDLAAREGLLSDGGE